jgi:hypothetical protein
MELSLCETLLLKLMLLDCCKSENSNCHHYGQKDVGLLLLFHRLFVLGAVVTLLLGAMYFAFMSVLNIIALIKSLSNMFFEISIDSGPALLAILQDFCGNVLHGLSELWSTCTRENIMSLFAIVIVYSYLPLIHKVMESYFSMQSMKPQI